MRVGDWAGGPPPVGDGATGSPWRPLYVTAAITAVVCLGLGLVLGQMTDSASSVTDDVAAMSADVDDADAVEAVVPEPETDVLGAVETRSTELVPAAVDHLVIVSVSVTACGERSTGTGVLIAENTILTAAHTVGDAGLVRVGHGTQVFTGEVAGVFADGRDLAIIELPAPLAEPVASGAVPTDGSPITVVGFPDGGARSSVVGPVVDVPDVAERLWVGPLTAVDAVTRTGMSGGPAVDANGTLVGVLVAAQPGTGTAVIAAVDSVAATIDAPLVDGACPASA